MARYVLTLFLIHSILLGLSQDNNLNLDSDPVTIPLSPNSASLGKYFKEPVGTHTGIPEINIPIWNITTGDINIPIGLNYHGGGIKVDEIASWVGLGWSLTATGNISRQVRGKKDENSYDYSKIEKYRLGLLSTSDEIQYINQILNNQIDSEPDIYYVSFPGIECSFIQAQSGEYITIPVDKNIKISKTDINKWLIVDPQGIKYYFQEPTHTENSFESFSSQNASEGNTELVNAVNSWSITKIVDNLGHEVTFQYDTFFYGITNRVSENVKVYTQSSTWCNGVEFTGTTSYTDFSEPILKTIKYNNTTVELAREPLSRKDLPGTNSLKEIRVFNGSSLLKTFKLHTSYFQSNPETFNPKFYAFKEQDKYRLRLDSIAEISGDQKIPPYKFSYKTNVSMPYRLSNSQDHWGFANGKFNSNFVTYSVNSTTAGANKDIDHNYAGAFTLTQIIYPTGGDMIFDYEGNEIKSTTSYSFKDTTLISLSIDNTVRGEEKGVFEVFGNFFVDAAKFDSHVPLTVKLSHLGFSPNDSFEIYLRRVGVPEIRIYSDLQSISIQPGNYSLYVKLLSEVDPALPHVASVNIELKAKVRVGGNINDSAGPGIRIKTISFRDKNVIVYQRGFQYNIPGSALSSGQLGSTPSYFVANLGRRGRYTSPIPNVPDQIYTCYWDQFSSYSSYPLSTTQSGHVGYSFVTEITQNLGSIVKAVYNYYNFEDNPDLLFTEFPFSPSSVVNYKRGLLKSREDFKYIGQNEFRKLKKESYKYTALDNSQKNVYGIKVAEIFTSFPGSSNEDVRYSNSNINLYRTYSDSYKIISDTTFYSEEGREMNKIGTYVYNSKHLLKNHTTYDSKGLKVERLLSYPGDYTSEIYRKMTLDNLVSKNVEEKLFLNGALSKSLNNIFKTKIVNNQNQYVLARKENYVNSSLLGHVDFVDYDNHGNPLEVKVLNKPSTVYLWGYGGQYPIAKIENATYSEVVGALGSGSAAILSALNAYDVSDGTITSHMSTLRDMLVNSQVTSYTYGPLVGMTSMTDPRGITEHYRYDGFQRLKDVLDFEKNVLTDYRYNYRQ
ncbi:hypothetical protein [Sphingobacterium daejeonense]|uniref:hypothetical protein n=1 Tax=Sphingobacterium daejeonense TaxID=371142 RepID=UPI003D31BE12